MRAQSRQIIAAAKRQAAAKAQVVAKFARPALPYTASPDDLPADFGRVSDAPVDPNLVERVGAAAERAGDYFRMIRPREDFDAWRHERERAMGRAAIEAMREPMPADLNARLWSADGEADDAPYRGRD